MPRSRCPPSVLSLAGLVRGHGRPARRRHDRRRAQALDGVEPEDGIGPPVEQHGQNPQAPGAEQAQQHPPVHAEAQLRDGGGDRIGAMVMLSPDQRHDDVAEQRGGDGITVEGQRGRHQPRRCGEIAPAP